MAKREDFKEEMGEGYYSLDKQIDKGRSKKKNKKEKPSYDEDFDKEVNKQEIEKLEKEKKALLKGIGDKSDAEKKAIREQLKELNDKIMALE